jgi:NAD(P) transhydrogenase subunit alpha
MLIGIPKEQLAGEARVAMTPELVKKLVGKGFTCQVESGAGVAAGYPDADYKEAGAELVDGARALAANIVLKVRKPSQQEIALMSDGAVYVGLIETCEDDGTLSAMFARNIQPISLERVPRISRAQSMDALSSQSNIAGYRAVIEAAAQYGRFFPLMMTSAGSAKPARVVVLGVGVAGLQAIATARRLGADVYAYDIRPETREQIESVGAKAIVLDLGESGSGEGGYAKELSDEAKALQQKLLADELAKAHVIITTALIPCRPAPTLVTEDVVKRMRDGSVIVDMAAASGGNCPLSEVDQVVIKHGVTLVGHSNYPSMVAADASAFLAKNIVNLLDIMVDQSDEGLVFKDFDQDEITQAALMRAQA